MNIKALKNSFFIVLAAAAAAVWFGLVDKPIEETKLVTEVSNGPLSLSSVDLDDFTKPGEIKPPVELETVFPAVASAYKAKYLTNDDIRKLRIPETASKTKKVDREMFHKILNKMTSEEATIFLGKLLAIIDEKDYVEVLPENQNGSINYEAILDEMKRKDAGKIIFDLESRGVK